MILNPQERTSERIKRVMQFQGVCEEGYCSIWRTQQRRKCVAIL